jgi:Flp pilus assembly protein TadD
LDPDYAVAFNSLGEAAFHVKRMDEAIDAFQRAIKLRPDYAHAYNNWGYVLEASGRFDEAEIKLKEAIKLDANYPDPWGNLARLYEKTNRGADLEAARASYAALGHLRSKTGAYPVFRLGHA